MAVWWEFGPVDWQYSLRTLAGLVAILDPFAAIPLFITLTADQAPGERQKTVHTTVKSVLIVLFVSAFAGELILQFFGISLGAFRVGGGIVILLMAVSMLQVKDSRIRETPEERAEGIQKADVAVVPLAIPLLAGPGTISAMILAGHQARNLTDYLALSTVIVIATFSVYFALRLAMPLSRRLGVTGMHIATRILGLVLAAIAIEFIAKGLIALFPALAHG